MNKYIKTIIFTLIIVFMLSLIGCSGNIADVKMEVSNTTTTTAVAEESKIEPTTTMKEKPELKISSILGYDSENSKHRLNNDVIEGNINSVKILLSSKNFDIAENDVSVIWQYEGTEIFKSETLDKESETVFSTGITIDDGFLYDGNYRILVAIDGKLADEKNFQVKLEDLKPVELSGSGKKSTDFFDIAGGLTIFEFTNQGSGNFIAKLMNEEGESVELLSNEIGNCSGKKAMYLPSGKYFINIEGGGSWKYIINQPRSFEIKELPYSFNGNTPNISDLFLVDKLAVITYSYIGEGNFIVKLLNENGEGLDLIANEIGNCEGSTTIKGDGNKYFISIEASDGNYEFEVKYKQ